MTLKELHERIGWQLEGQLQFSDGHTWRDVSDDESPPHLGYAACCYRRRPDPAPMPDEVWISTSEPWRGNFMAFRQNESSDEYIRYVRAGAVIPASQLEVSLVGANQWRDAYVTGEYRIKP